MIAAGVGGHPGTSTAAALARVSTSEPATLSGNNTRLT
jgi:hypothetical protein